ncbi:hypothetical protein O181_094003 [Austropuccinia psidii MF-1]|uniref:Uncharacterized protein n=1 Tax=Austropuccinia psidii MF-1 TaxID=1389203 RepID=A0A9Q3J1A3_9BASI|nr:hypothetical protein [Austropuccinia psidii MF-1]
MPCEQTPQQPTPGTSGTQWSEDLSHEPSQHNEPPLPGPSPPSKPPEDFPTCDPEPAVAPKQSTEDPLDPPSLTPPPFPCVTPPSTPTPVPSSPHSHNDACQEFANL